MPEKEAKARIKINRLLQESEWRLEDNREGKANVVFESHVKITSKGQDDLGEDFEHTKNGFIDCLTSNTPGKIKK